MGRNDAKPDQRLREAAAASHRRWFELAAPGNRLASGNSDVAALVREARQSGTASFGVWSLGPDDRLGVRLVARGFEWGWRPHWMGVELDREPEPPAGFEVAPAEPPFAETLPYRLDGSLLPADAIHLGVRLREKIIGQVVVLLGDDGVAGIYSMSVVPKVQGRGIGLALTRAALRAAWERGYRAAVLNATSDGERLYARAGFRSLGWGQTWWSRPGPEPTERQIWIAEAVGLGDLAAIEALAPSEAEVASGRTAPIVLATIVGEVASLEHLLARFPGLATSRFGPDRGTLLHLAAELDRPEVAELALRHGADPRARDATYGATAAGWAEHLDRPSLRRLLS